MPLKMILRSQNTFWGEHIFLQFSPVEKYSSGYYRVLLRRSGEYTLCRGWILNMLGDRLAGFTYMGQAEHVKIRVYQNTKFH